MADNVAGAIAYLTFIPAVLFLILDPYKNRPFVGKFNAIPVSVSPTFAWFCVGIVAIIPILGWIVAFVGIITVAVFWVICIVKADERSLLIYKVPVIGDLRREDGGRGSSAALIGL